jgi:hypothetical protein
VWDKGDEEREDSQWGQCHNYRGRISSGVLSHRRVTSVSDNILYISKHLERL